MHKFRLVNDSARPVLFMADSNTLTLRLHSAFIEFCNGSNLNRAMLEVHHTDHGWNQVFDFEKNYVIINNPLALDYSRLACAVGHTLYECDSWPTEQEKIVLKKERQAQEREFMAEAHRNAFRVI